MTMKVGDVSSFVHANRKGFNDCGGRLVCIGEVDYGPFSASEFECQRCGEKLDATDAYYEMLSVEEYRERYHKEPQVEVDS